MTCDMTQYSLADLCLNVSYGHTASATGEPIGPKFLRITDIQGGIVDWGSVPFCEADEPARQKTLLQYGDIVIARTGNSTGENYFFDCDEHAVFASYLIRFRVDPLKANPYFVWLNLRTQTWWNYVAGAKSGSAQAGANAKVLGKFELLLPDRETQDKVEKIVRALNDKIRYNSLLNQTLEQIAQAIFKSWFVDFEPVKVKIAALEVGGSEENALLAAMQVISAKDETELARFQAEQPTQYAELRATAKLFPSALQESELGEIPEGWAARPFGELLEKTIGGDWGKEEPDGKHTERVKILRGTDLPNVYAGDDRKVPTRYVEPKKLKTRRLKPGDIVIEVSGGSKGQPTGRSLFLTSLLLKRLGICEPASFCRLFRPKGQETGLFLGLYLQHIYAEGKTWLYQNQSTGISNFQTKIFLEHELVATPPEQVTYSFYERTIPLINQIHSDENAVLAEIRDALLPKLLSGELSVSDAENYLVEEVDTADV